VTIHVPPSLAESGNSPLIVDAVYFVVRVLGNALRGYSHSEVSTEPSPPARQLAETVIKEIEYSEQTPITRMEDNRLEEYISGLNTFLTERAMPVSESLLEDAEQILQEMRAYDT
jgi:hypothetical protein